MAQYGMLDFKSHQIQQIVVRIGNISKPLKSPFELTVRQSIHLTGYRIKAMKVNMLLDVLAEYRN